MATTRKTAKYYREELVRPHSVTDLENLIKEVCTKFGGKDNSISLWNRVEYNWNHRVEGFDIAKNGRVLVKVYWQGDSTDGTDYVYLTDVLRKGIEVIRAEHHFDCGRTYEVHGDIRVEKYEVVSLVSELAKWLSADEIKKRKISAMLFEKEQVVNRKLGNDYYNEYACGWGANKEGYYNGCAAVRQLVKELGEKLLKMEDAEILRVVDVVFKKNNKNDYYFGKKSMWDSKTKPYDITY